MRILLLLFLTILSSCVTAQEITGFWNGRANLLGRELRVVFELEGTPDQLTGTFQSPDQSDISTPLSGVYRGDSLILNVSEINLVFRGAYDPARELISGNMQQTGQSFPVVLQRDPLDEREVIRPQTPEPPFPYTQQEVLFKSDGFALYGTLTIPQDAPQAAVVLITGSGPQNRDAEMLDHKPFLVLADHLSRNGIMVLRYDERGVGASEGNFVSATSTDFARDAGEALRWLKSQDATNGIPVGLIGHSEGGLIAAMTAAEFESPDFIVSLAGMGVSGAETLIKQNEDIMIAEGLPAEAAQAQAERMTALVGVLQEEDDSLAIEKGIREVLKEHPTDNIGLSKDQAFELYNEQLNSPWMRELIRTDAREYWKQVRCDVLAINGTRDVQVKHSVNLKAIEFALRRAGNEDYTTIALPNHNHLLQETMNGAVSQYGQIEQTLSPTVLTTVSDWILNL